MMLLINDFLKKLDNESLMFALLVVILVVGFALLYNMWKWMRGGK